MSFLAATFVIGVVVISPFYVGEIASGRLIECRLESILAVAYVGVFPSLIAYLFFNRGVELLGSAATGLYLNIMPVIGALLSALLLAEPIRWYHFAGMALIGVGVLSVVRSAGSPLARDIEVSSRQ